MLSFFVNGKELSTDADPDTPLLWVLREAEGQSLTGTKFGCGAGACGACTVLVGRVARRTCVTLVSEVEGALVTTIEGLSSDLGHPLQQAWIEEQVPQCGYCQSGMIMAAAALLAEKPVPSDADIDEAITNICRCGTYARIRRAIHRAGARLSGDTAR
jgi:isoquinoline 1-oxidoreductase subunit alpha